MKIRTQYKISREGDPERAVRYARLMGTDRTKVKLPPRQQRVCDAAEEFGVLDRWLYVGDLGRLLSLRPATSKTCEEIFEGEKDFYDSKSGAVRQVAEVSGIVPRPDQEVLVFGSYMRKSDAARVVAEVKFSFGACGAVVAHHPIPGLNYRFAMVDVLDPSAWYGTMCGSSIHWPRYGRFVNVKMDGEDWCYTAYSDPAPLENTMSTAEVDALVAKVTGIAPPPAPARAKPMPAYGMYKVAARPVSGPAQLVALASMLAAVDGTVRRYKSLEELVVQGAAAGLLATRQGPARILAYYRQELVRQGVLTKI